MSEKYTDPNDWDVVEVLVTGIFIALVAGTGSVAVYKIVTEHLYDFTIVVGTGIGIVVGCYVLGRLAIFVMNQAYAWRQRGGER